MDTNFKHAMLNSNWSSICRRTEVHLAGMSTNWSREVYQVVVEKAREFVALPPPRSDAEVHKRFSQSMGLTSIIACASHVESMLGEYPHRLDDRVRLVKAVCALNLPTTRQEDGEIHSARMAISAQVSSISFDEMSVARRLR